MTSFTKEFSRLLPHRDFEPPPYLISEPPTRARPGRVDDECTLPCDQNKAAVQSRGSICRVPVEIPVDLLQRGRAVRTRGSSEVVQHAAVGVLGRVDGDAVVFGHPCAGRAMTRIRAFVS